MLYKPHQGYSGSSTLDMLTHLYATYGVISNTYWLENDKRLCDPYLPSVLIKVAWQQIENAIAYTNTGLTPYSGKQVTDNA